MLVSYACVRWTLIAWPNASTTSTLTRSPSLRASGCLTCEYFRGQWSGGHVVCERFERDNVIGAAHLGCAYWMRAIGIYD